MTGNPDKLDRLLQKWAEENSASPEELATLKQRILVGSATESHTVTLPDREPTSSRRPRRYRLAVLAAAATLLIALFFVHAWRQSAKPSNLADGLQKLELMTDRHGPEASFLPVPADFVKNQARKLVAFQEVFEQQVAWVAESNGRSAMSLHAIDSTASAAPANYVAIQLALWSRPRGESWKRVQFFTVLANREELVEFTNANGETSQLAVWAYPIDDELISIDLRYQPPGLAGVQIDSSDLLRRSETTNIHSFEQDGVEYRLFQLADLLDDDLG